MLGPDGRRRVTNAVILADQLQPSAVEARDAQRYDPAAIIREGMLGGVGREFADDHRDLGSRAALGRDRCEICLDPDILGNLRRQELGDARQVLIELDVIELVRLVELRMQRAMALTRRAMASRASFVSSCWAREE